MEFINLNSSVDNVAGEVHKEGNNNTGVTKCCSGLCVDLLRKFEDDLGFTYELVRAADPKYGTYEVKRDVLLQHEVLFEGWEVEWSDGRFSEQEDRPGALCSQGLFRVRVGRT